MSARTSRLRAALRFIGEELAAAARQLDAVVALYRARRDAGHYEKAWRHEWQRNEELTARVEDLLGRIDKEQEERAAVERAAAEQRAALLDRISGLEFLLRVAPAPTAEP